MGREGNFKWYQYGVWVIASIYEAHHSCSDPRVCILLLTGKGQGEGEILRIGVRHCLHIEILQIGIN